MRTTRRPDSPPPRPRAKGSSSSSSSSLPPGSRWSDDSLSSESSESSYDHFDHASDKAHTMQKTDEFAQGSVLPKDNHQVGADKKNFRANIDPPKWPPVATNLVRSRAVRVGIAGRKTSLISASEVAETRGRGRTRTAPFAIEVLEFATTKIHMIKTGAKGAYGEYYLGVDEKGALVGVKELRSKYEVDDLAREGTAAPTRATLRIHASREAKDTQRFVPQLQVRDLVVGRDKKPYLIMKPMDGTVDDLLFKASPENLKMLGRTALYALAEHAGQIHRQGGIHGDMKAANALYSKEGMMCVADCGLTSRTPTNIKLVGTYFSPEMIEKQEAYDGKIDTWSLMVSLAAAYNPHGSDEAFCGSTREEIQEKLINFSAWRSHELGGAVPPEYLKNNPFDSFFAPLKKADPELAHYIIERGLSPFAKGRVSCEQIPIDLAQLGHGHDKQAEGLKLLALMPVSPRREQQEKILRELSASKR